MTKVVQCDCVSEYQDRRYGIGRRVANKTDNGDFRCTVCGKSKSAGTAKEMKK